MKPDGFRGVFRTDELARAIYSEGAGISRAIPEAIAVASDAADVEAIVRWASKERKALIPRGSASGMAGGAVGSGIVLDLSRLQRIQKIDSARKTVSCEPGVICRTVDDLARKDKLRLPVDPSSAGFCTIGGMASTNAAGPHSLKYGSMRKWVSALDCVFSDGSRGRIERGSPPPDASPIREFLRVVPQLRAVWKNAADDHAGVRKDSSGYALRDYFETGELIDLMVGSEGTLCVIVEAELDLVAVPAGTASLLAAFSSLESAALGASVARKMGAAACELLDQTFLAIAASAPESSSHLRELADGTAAVLLIELEFADGDSREGESGALRTALEEAGGRIVDVAMTPDSEKLLWELRHAASPILSRLTGMTSMQFIEDSAVPPDRLADYVAGVRRALAHRGVAGVVFGHAGDAHVHVNPLIEMEKSDWRKTVGGLLDDVVALTSNLGGTLSGEHGDGRLRTPLMSRVWSKAAIESFTLVKNAFDPRGILNPGVKTSDPSSASMEAIKYDPDLAPLPKRVREALDHIVSRREYSAFRLSLID